MLGCVRGNEESGDVVDRPAVDEGLEKVGGGGEEGEEADDGELAIMIAREAKEGLDNRTVGGCLGFFGHDPFWRDEEDYTRRLC